MALENTPLHAPLCLVTLKIKKIVLFCVSSTEITRLAVDQSWTRLRLSPKLKAGCWVFLGSNGAVRVETQEQRQLFLLSGRYFSLEMDAIQCRNGHHSISDFFLKQNSIFLTILSLQWDLL